jgi:hypothetical protein
MTIASTLVPEFDLSNPSTLTLDLANPKPKDVLALVAAFEEALEDNPDVGKLPVKTGWNKITPEIAVNLLMRNPRGANRKVDPATVLHYARQMANNRWKATGQPMLVDSEGRLLDAQHRLYALLVSGATIKTYVVTDIEAAPGLFAYVDASRPRTAATALQTAGMNGVSPIIVKVINIGESINHGVYNPSGATKLPRLAAYEVLELAKNYPNAQKAARSTASDWEEATELLGGRKEVVAYMGMRIIDLFGEDKADDFYDEVMDHSERSADDPFYHLRKLANNDAHADKPMKKHYMLAALIKVFNAWHMNQPLGRRWMLQVNEDFPTIVGEEVQAEAAQ